MKFECKVKFTKQQKTDIIIPFEMNIEKNENGIMCTFDEIEFEADDVIIKEFGKDIPIVETEYFIIEDGKRYPVKSENEDKKIIDKYAKEYGKVLILPVAVYTLSPEMECYMNMIKSGIIDEDTEFDYEKFKNFLENNKNNN